MISYTHHPENVDILRPYAFGFKPIGDLAFMAEQNTTVITGQLNRIGSALSSGTVQPSIRDSVMADLNALNETFGKAAGAELMNPGDIEDQLRRENNY